MRADAAGPAQLLEQGRVPGLDARLDAEEDRALGQGRQQLGPGLEIIIDKVRAYP
jgi:hypothetical protein